MAETYIWQLNEKYLTNVSGATQNPNGSINGVQYRENTTGNKFYRWQTMSWNDYEMASKIDSSNQQIENERKSQETKKYKDAETQFNIKQQSIKKERQALLDKSGVLSLEEQEKLARYNTQSKESWKDIPKDEQLIYGTLGLTANAATTNPIAPPVRATEQPGVVTPWQPAISGSRGWSTPPPEKNAANQYTFANGQKEFDSTAIPEVLNKWRITPVQYFTKNGLSWMKDSKRIATEMGMANYRGTPGENYALVAYIEEKKNGNPTAGGQENQENSRKFDGIKSDLLPNRFTQEDRDKVEAMTPDEQAKYIEQRGMEDLKKMLPGNVGLINKVFGTNYTSDDLTGGSNRATIMGTGMTAKGMEVQKLIDNLMPGTASKFMRKWGELDNSVKDSERIATWSVQSGRRKILEDMVDGRTPVGQGTTIDGQDQEYMQAYKNYKRVKANADRYNSMINVWNTTDPNNIARNKQLSSIQDFVNNMKDTDPESFEALRADLDKIPAFMTKGSTGKLTTVNVGHPADAKATPGGTDKITIAPATNNNISTPTPVAWTPARPVAPNKDTPDNTGQPAPVAPNPVAPVAPYKSSGYVKEDPETRYWYSSNAISKW